MAYPDAPRTDLVEHLHGHPVADPYRWLEDADDPRTRAWTQAQDALATEALAALPARAAFAAALEQLVHAGAVGVPVWRAGRAFSTRRDPGQEHAVLRVREPDGTHRTLIDPMALTRPAPPPSTPGRRPGRATGWPTSSPSAATRNPRSTCSTSPPARSSTGRSAAAATPPSPGCPAATSSATSAGWPPTRCPPVRSSSTAGSGGTGWAPTPAATS